MLKDGKTDVKDAQVVDEQAADAKGQPSVEDQVAQGQDVKTDQPKNEKLADGQSVADKTVPFTRFQEIERAKKEAEERAAMLEMALSSQPEQAQPEQPMTMQQQILQRMGVEPGEYLNAEQQARLFGEMMQMMTVAQIGEQFVNQHPDFDKVVGTTGVNGQFVPAQPLMRALKKPENAYVAQAIREGNPYARQMAYQVAVNDPDYQAQIKEQNTPPGDKAAADVKAVLEAQNKQPSIGNAKSGGGNISRKQAIQNMTNEEFAEYKRKIIARA